MSGILEAFMDNYVRGNVQPPFSDWFQRGSDGENPNSDHWSVVEDEGATVDLEYSATDGIQVLITSGTTATSDAAMHSKDKVHFCPNKLISGETFHFKTRLRMNDLIGEYAFGLAAHIYVPEDNYFQVGGAGIFVDDDVVTFYSDGSGGTVESTAVTSYFADGTTVEVEIVITDSDAKCYIDGTLRATHSTSYPDQYGVYLLFRTKNSNSTNSIMEVVYTSAWVEKEYEEELTATRAALTEIPARTADALTKIDMLFERFCNKMDVSSDEFTLYQDNESSTLGTQSVSSADGTTTIGEMS